MFGKIESCPIEVAMTPTEIRSTIRLQRLLYHGPPPWGWVTYILRSLLSNWLQGESSIKARTAWYGIHHTKPFDTHCNRSYQTAAHTIVFDHIHLNDVASIIKGLREYGKGVAYCCKGYTVRWLIPLVNVVMSSLYNPWGNAVRRYCFTLRFRPNLVRKSF